MTETVPTPEDARQDAVRPCGIEECGKPHYALGWCNMHWQRWRKYGDPRMVKQVRRSSPLSPDEFWSNITKQDECWHWAGRVDPQGYGFVSHNGTKPAHRVSYELAFGPIPSGLTIDHVCHTKDLACKGGPECQHRRCINPEHLEPVTQAENTRRAQTVQRRNVSPETDRCRQNHMYTPENTYHRANGKRECRTCMSAGSRRRYLKTKETRDGA